MEDPDLSILRSEEEPHGGPVLPAAVFPLDQPTPPRVTRSRCQAARGGLRKAGWNAATQHRSNSLQVSDPTQGFVKVLDRSPSWNQTSILCLIFLKLVTTPGPFCSFKQVMASIHYNESKFTLYTSLKWHNAHLSRHKRTLVHFNRDFKVKNVCRHSDLNPQGVLVENFKNSEVRKSQH